jgi:hypothetical protein
MNRAGLLALIVLTLLVSACGSRTAQPEPQPTSAPTVTPADTDAVSPLPLPTSATDAESPLPPPTEVVTPTPTMPVFDMATFRDDVTGFEIDYPVGWTIIDPPADVKANAFIYSVTLQSWPLEEPGTQGIPEGGSKMDISITKEGAETLEGALEIYRQSQAQAEMPVEVVSEEELELASGLKGARFELENSQGETYHTFVMSLNGHLIILSGLGDVAVFDAMAATLRTAPVE